MQGGVSVGGQGGKTASCHERVTKVPVTRSHSYAPATCGLHPFTMSSSFFAPKAPSNKKNTEKQTVNPSLQPWVEK